MCGRVVCHSCSSTMLFYEVSGKKQRTCEECVKNGGPSASRLAKTSNQKNIFTLVLVAKAKADAEAAEAEGAGGGKKLSEEEKTYLKNRNKTSDVAHWADRGLAMDHRALKAVYAEAAPGGASPPVVKFSVFLPEDAELGDSVEVTLPDLATRVVAVVGSDDGPGGAVNRTTKARPRLKVEVAFGEDGVCFAVPPPEGQPAPELLAAAEERAEVRRKEAAEKAANSLGKDALGALKDSGVAGSAASSLGVPGF